MMKKKIMVIDDEPDQILTIKLILEDMSDKYEVIGANSGMQCLQLLKNNQIPDIIFLDIMMPEMNGWELARLLRKNIEWRKIPIIFLTATEDETSKITGKIIGEAFIEKPFDVPSLMKKIDEILSKK